MSGQTVPGRIRPGQRTTQGTRTPPSHSVPLPSLRGPAEPPWFPKLSQGPLSLRKKTIVLRSRPWAFRASRIRPTEASSSMITSP